MLRDREFVKGLLTRARAAGFTTLVLTADLTWFGKRERDLRNGFTVPPSYSLQQVRTHKNNFLPLFFSLPLLQFRGESRKILSFFFFYSPLTRHKNQPLFLPQRGRESRTTAFVHLLSLTHTPSRALRSPSYITFPFPAPWLHSCHRLTLSHVFS